LIILFTAWAITIPIVLSTQFNQLICFVNERANNPPIIPDIKVIEKTQERIIRRNLEIRSISAFSGKLHELRIVDHFFKSEGLFVFFLVFSSSAILLFMLVKKK